ncbi:tRNA dimethylallyltransferase [Cryptococcus neoformans Tu401-1]|nr:tRNA dimethylallyltransferase [Cryptococcus neoformans var. grubii Tu401-1]
MLNFIRSLKLSIRSQMTSQRPIVAVIGTTGVGKSQLAVSLAQSFSLSRATRLGMNSNENKRRPAVVLSADSMQLYTGLDVITNKVTVEEMGGIEHWGLNMVTPGEDTSWEVGKWCNEANAKISTLPIDVLPIVCGGTHYFIQHFLFPPPELSFVRDDEAKSQTKNATSVRWTPPGPRPPIPENLSPELLALLDTFWLTEPTWPSTSESSLTQRNPGPSKSSRPTTREDDHLLALYRLLETIDPKESQRWHWRDGRKVRRSLERWWERGGTMDSVLPSNVLSESKGREARFRTLIFWVYEPMETLRPRLDRRVDKMLENGLLDEIAELREIAQRVYGSTDATDHTEGIFQAIGYKEFASLPLPSPDPQSHPLFPAMVDRTKVSTQQYAKSQLKWIKKQLLPAVREARSLGGEVEVYVIPGGETGVPLATEILHKFMEREKVPSNLEVGHVNAKELLHSLEENGIVPNTADRQSINARKICEICSTTNNPCSVLLREWDQHTKTRAHRYNANPIKMDKAEWIARQKAMGEERKAERQRLKQESMAVELEQKAD